MLGRRHELRLWELFYHPGLEVNHGSSLTCKYAATRVRKEDKLEAMNCLLSNFDEQSLPGYGRSGVEHLQICCQCVLSSEVNNQ